MYAPLSIATRRNVRSAVTRTSLATTEPCSCRACNERRRPTQRRNTAAMLRACNVSGFYRGCTQFHNQPCARNTHRWPSAPVTRLLFPCGSINWFSFRRCFSLLASRAIRLFVPRSPRTSARFSLFLSLFHWRETLSFTLVVWRKLDSFVLLFDFLNIRRSGRERANDLAEKRTDSCEGKARNAKKSEDGGKRETRVSWKYRSAYVGGLE